MKKQQKIIRYIGLLLFLFVYFVSPRVVSAVACTGLPSIGDLSLSNCILTVAGTTGSDQAGNIEGSTENTADLLLSTGTSVTINATGTLVVGSISPQGGSIAIDNGGQIKLNTPLYVPDADADGWATDFSTVYTATSAGRRRLSLMRSAATADCGDSTYATNNVCCTVATRYQDADADTYGNPSVSISACTTAGYVDNNTDCNDTGTNAANVYVSATCYVDADNDDYGSATSRNCTNNATCGSATWASVGTGAAASGNFAANASDCYDSNASAYPGSGVCSTGSRGDGSFDWNCSGGASACGTTFYSTVNYGNGYCIDQNTCGGTEYNPRCCVCGTITYIGGGVGCGGGGYSAGTYGASDQCGCGGCRIWGYFPGYYGAQACQ